MEVDWRDKKSRAIIREDYNGLIERFELKPGDSYRPIILDYNTIDINRVKNIYVRDATGKIYKHKIVHKF